MSAWKKIMFQETCLKFEMQKMENFFLNNYFMRFKKIGEFLRKISLFVNINIIEEKLKVF